MIAPLAFVVGLSMAKEALEDWQRFIQDMKVNLRKVSVHKGGGQFGYRSWQKIQVGDVVKVEKDQFFPADLLLLSSSYEDGICYVETMNLDGETNLKVKRSLEITLPLDDDEVFNDFKGMVRCEDPNSSLYTFVGNLEYDRQIYALDPNQILLRDSKLRNTTFVYGVVIFSGHDTKVMQNATKSPSKRSRIERKMDSIIYILFSILVLISLISSICFAVMTKHKMPKWWYLQPHNTTNLYDPSKPAVAGITHLITALILYGYLIPISLYISIEVVKVLQAMFINQDIQLFDEVSGNPAQARTSNLNEELGQVDTILSDKTGTLTSNQMDFLKCSIAGVSYGVNSSEVEIAAAKQLDSETSIALDLYSITQDFESKQGGEFQSSEIETENSVSVKARKGKKSSIKGFSFEDSRLMNGKWKSDPNVDTILLFFQILAVCHTAIPELNEETGSFNYEAESPDEGAFLVAAREFGFEFFKRTQSSVFIREMHTSGSTIDREFKILNLLEFNSKRKRMSVVVRNESGEILVMCKGADSVILERLSKHGRMYEEDTKMHLNEYGEAGLRTLALAYKKLEEAEYSSWNNEFIKAKTSIGSDREAMLEQVADLIEKDLILVGATAVEDKLQKGVPRCIDKLAQAGLKIWVLTGDKMETAINIGFACSLLRQGMKQICISAMHTDLIGGDAEKAIKENMLMQIANATQAVKLEQDPHAAFALIIDGKALTYALDNDMKNKFLNLAVDCASVICCGFPEAKALVTRLVKEGTGKTTLAIGDGANDVGMIQEADIGVGISGVEGMQAVMASDFSIAQFRFLERLLIVHGHWCYKRIAQMICYFIYKNIAFGLTLFYFEAYTAFSGQSVYDDWYMLLFNVVLTSLPVISLGVFEQDLSSEVCLQFPALYQQGPKNLFFDWYRIIGWMVNGVYSSLAIYFLTINFLRDQAFRAGGQTTDMAVVGTIMFTGIIWAVNVQIALKTSHFTWIQHLFVWGSIATWYIFLLGYGFSSPLFSGYSFRILDAVAPAPIYWFAALIVATVCNVPYFVHIAYQRFVHPMDHHVIQEIKIYKKDLEDQRMWKREKSKGRQKTKIGLTARVDAKIRQLRGKTPKKALPPLSVETLR
ncbi:hypothetical protein HPP92_000516 [Vanilla planifolia]|uniref:Phospholipid-transporting ATPase n=1 Tax=Vanilla planifolia TaxID=51239 RepID=A0A835S2Z8_VANPL|nr:hypothetical protein HPP92_000516 [Vanilla planifolia]